MWVTFNLISPNTVEIQLISDLDDWTHLPYETFTNIILTPFAYLGTPNEILTFPCRDEYGENLMLLKPRGPPYTEPGNEPSSTGMEFSSNNGTFTPTLYFNPNDPHYVTFYARVVIPSNAGEFIHGLQMTGNYSTYGQGAVTRIMKIPLLMVTIPVSDSPYDVQWLIENGLMRIAYES
jgi:hypothetical protein